MANGDVPPEESVAFAPGHLTGLFVPVKEGSDRRAWGSLGLGVVLGMGARSRVRRAKSAPRSIDVEASGKGIGVGITYRAIESLVKDVTWSGRLEVKIDHELPVARGLGMSAAGTLSATLAVAKLLHLPVTDAIDTAHIAEVEGGGGLGGVPAILGGGLEVRRKAGVPPFGEVERTRCAERLIIACWPEAMDSRPLLTDPAFLTRVSTASGNLLQQAVPPPVRSGDLMTLSQRFTERLGLASPPLVRGLEVCREFGVPAAQAMLGNTLFAFSQDHKLVERLVQIGFEVFQTSVGDRGGTLPD